MYLFIHAVIPILVLDAGMILLQCLATTFCYASCWNMHNVIIIIIVIIITIIIIIIALSWMLEA